MTTLMFYGMNLVTILNKLSNLWDKFYLNFSPSLNEDWILTPKSVTLTLNFDAITYFWTHSNIAKIKGAIKVRCSKIDFQLF